MISRQERADLTCPSCGQPFQADVWLVLDKAERPDLVHRLLDGELNVLRCPNCGAEGGISHPLMYHDGVRQQVVCAMPLSVNGPTAARTLVGDLLQSLVIALPAAERGAYLSEVELVPEVDGLRAHLIEQALADDTTAEDRMVALAVGELINVAGQNDFERVIAEHRTLLLSDRAERALDDLLQTARTTADRSLQRRAVEAKAVLSRFRATLHQRRATLAALLDELAPLSDAEIAVLPGIRAMLAAIDPQAVFAARIALPPASRDTADALIARLAEHAVATHQTEVVSFLRQLAALPQQ